MKIAKGVLYVLAIAGALAAFGWFFVSELGGPGSGRKDELAGVLLSPPPDYDVVERGELTPTEAAAELELQTLQAGADKVGVHFRRQGGVVYWLADITGDSLEERAAGPSGTRLQTTWPRGLRRRLAWAREHGDFEAPGLPAPEKKNLYH
jgi:hypothetical protein